MGQLEMIWNGFNVAAIVFELPARPGTDLIPFLSISILLEMEQGNFHWNLGIFVIGLSDSSARSTESSWVYFPFLLVIFLPKPTLIRQTFKIG